METTRPVPCDRLCFVGTDIYVECSIAAHRMGERLEGRGKVAVVGVIDPRNAEAQIKTRIFISQLTAHYPGVRVVASIGSGKWDIRNRSRELTLDLLAEHGDLAGIYSNVDEAMKGIAEAAEIAEASPCIIGPCNEPHLMDMIADGRISCGLVYNRFAYGFDAVVLLYNHIVAGRTPVRRRLLSTPEVADPDNLDDIYTPQEGFLVSDRIRRHLCRPVNAAPRRTLRFELQLEGVGTWFAETIRGAREAGLVLPDTEVIVNNWRLSDMTDEQMEEKRIAELDRARADGVDGVVLWVLNDHIVPHINEVVRQGMQVVVFHTEPVNYDAITPEVDEVFASLFRQMLLRDAAEERLRRLSNEDELTGLFNRRRFNTFMEEEWKAMSRTTEACLSVLMVDVDHFKQFNDRFGHLCGDQCLQKTAGVLRAIARRSKDFVARYGGEEFCLVLPNTDRNGALRLACELRAAVEEARADDCPPFAGVTVSVGVATASGRDGRYEGWAGLVSAADAALYRAKQNGRNRVASAD